MVLTPQQRQDIYASVAALSIVATGFGIGAALDRNHIRRGALSGIGALLAAGATGIAYTLGEKAQKYGKVEEDTNYEKFREFHRADFKRWFMALNPEVQAEMFLNAMEGESLPELPPAEDFGIPLYAWESVITEACGLLICGNSGLGKTSIAKLIAGILTSQKPARVLVCDPHANKNKWEEAGLKAIYDYKEIEQTLYWAELELNRRREPGAEPGERFILILDELGECFDYFEDVERIKRIIRQLGTRSRKYDACAIILNHSDNCAAIGLDGKYRDNYLQISLGALARKRFKKGTPELAFLETQAYPCAVGGPVPWICAKHPTHGDYTEFQTEGLPPLVTLPINQIKAMAPTASENNHHGIKLENRPQNEAKIQNLNPLEALEKAYAMPIVLSEAEEKLLLIAAQYGSIHGREVMRALHLDNMEMVRSLFAKWEECGIGRSFPTEKGSVEFRVIAEDDKK
jgi:hypothetical protein